MKLCSYHKLLSLSLTYIFFHFIYPWFCCINWSCKILLCMVKLRVVVWSSFGWLLGSTVTLLCLFGYFVWLGWAPPLWFGSLCNQCLPLPLVRSSFLDGLDVIICQGACSLLYISVHEPAGPPACFILIF
jgi:hypothetical protein